MPNDDLAKLSKAELQERLEQLVDDIAIDQAALEVARQDLASAMRTVNVLVGSTTRDERTLDERMAAVQAELEDVPRRGHAEVETRGGGRYEYDYILEADLMAGIRPLLARHGVAVYYSDELLSFANGVATVRVEIRYRARGEEIVTQATALGSDKGDKAANKAKTAGVRYLLWKTFLQPSDEDPEQENVSTDDAAKAHADRERRHALAAGTSTRRTEGGEGETKGRLMQRVTELAVELDDVQARPAGSALTKLLAAVGERKGADEPTLADLDSNELVRVGQALADHVKAERQAAERDGLGYDPTDFDIPEIG